MRGTGLGRLAGLLLASVVAARTGEADRNRLTFVPGSTTKVEQLIGDVDKQRKTTTSSRTVSRYDLDGTDLGYSFEHHGRLYFLFGDTVGQLGRALDSIGTTDVRDPDAGVRLDFLTAQPPAGRRGGRQGRGDAGRATTYLTIQPPGISMGPFEVPVSGVSLNGQIYIVVSTNHSADRSTDRSVLTKFTPPATFQPLRTISQLPAGHFVKMSLHAEPSPPTGLPSGGPFLLMWGTGPYRTSDAYLAIVPAAHFETGEGTRYYAGLGQSGAPIWSEREGDAVPIVRNGTMGDLSVTWCRDLNLWLMTYDSRSPATQGILFSYSAAPWGPWSDPQVIFNGARDGALGAFIHDPRANPPDGLAGPVIGQGRADPEAVRGGAYAPYVVERWTRKRESTLTIHYVLSTWNPYVVVLMRSSFTVQ
jgi:Domain of unknown function (DUF4185)